MPDQYMIDQNYPNPFTVATRFTYGLPERSQVILEVYKTGGGVIARVVDAEEEAGYKTVEFDAGAVRLRSSADGRNSPMPGGVYIYRFVAISVANPGKVFVQARKMILLKES